MLQVIAFVCALLSFHHDLFLSLQPLYMCMHIYVHYVH